MHAAHAVFIWIGTGQWGKTVGVNSFANEGIFWDRDIVMVNYPYKFVRENYPARYRSEKWPKDLKDIPKQIRSSKDFVIIDDAVFLAGARDHGTRENKELQKLLTIASHHELFISVTIQNTSLLDFSVMQAQDVFMFHKKMDALSMEFERPMIKARQVVANIKIDQYAKAHPAIHPKAWTWCSTTNEMFTTKMPDWWMPRMSKPFYGVMPG